MSIRSAAWLLAAVPFAGCGDHMNEGSGHMGAALAEAQEETRQHGDRCGSAASMREVSDELARHEEAMGAVMGRVDDAMGMMHGMHCSGSNMDGMMQTVSTMKAAMQTHHDTMMSASELTSARDECARHRDEMMSLCSTGRERSEAMSCM